MTNINKPNRIKTKSPKKSGKSWCNGCDATYIGKGQKCPICGWVPNNIYPKTLEKPQHRYFEEDIE